MGLQRVRHDRATEHALTHITACIVKTSGMKSQTIAKSVLTAVTAADCFLAAAVVLMEDIQHPHKLVRSAGSQAAPRPAELGLLGGSSDLF